jgi:hypothetical protein
MRMEGVSFRHAVELLRADWSPEPLAARTPPQSSTVRKLESPLSGGLPDGVLLSRVVGFYQATLRESPANHPAFYLWTVRMPLVVPTDVVDLSWSERIGGSSWVFDPSVPATREAVAQAAKVVCEDAASGGVLIAPPGSAENVRMQEAGVRLA